MNWLAHLLTDVSSVPHIILVYSLVIAVGALLGRIRLFGVSLGVTFVLFAAIAAGHFGFTVNPAVLYFLRDFGLTVFIYFIGLHRWGPRSSRPSRAAAWCSTFSPCCRCSSASP